MTSKLITLFCLAVLVVPFAGCRVEQTQEGELPEVEVEGGQLPEYEVDAADVEIGTETREIEVPTIDITMPEEKEEEEEPPPQS
ncbi:MAG TPA: hypothetical protein VMR44_09490 [Thermoanaerobaculia bacterium]|nr:hypothetical protein [Thermoanaerobaculia bacterium]